ncbi:MAG: ferritin family protein [Magnetococcales bacterium]|nr:ferritin family protein [Magnetococcales bacterium]
MHSFEEVMRHAIQHEDAEAAFYQEMAARSKSAEQRDIMLEHARQEGDHKRRLQEILANDRLPSPGVRRFPDPDLKLSDYLVVDERPVVSLDYQEALLLAAKREKKAQKLYQDLAALAETPEVRAALVFLAEQEGKHAQALEQAYDDTLQ